MFARDMRLYDVYTLGDTDAYGQKGAPAYSRTIKAAIYERAQMVGQNALYIEGDFIALTRSNLTSSDFIHDGQRVYKVLYMERRGTYNQAYMKLASE